MQYYTFLLIIVALFSLQAGVVVLLKNPDLKLNRLLFVSALCLSVWAFGYSMVSISNTQYGISFWFKFSSLGWSFFPASILSFVVYFIEINFIYKHRRFIIGVSLFISAFVFYSALLGLVEIKPIYDSETSTYIISLSNSLINNIYYSIYFLIIISSILLLIVWNIRKEEKSLRIQRFMLILALIIFVVFVVNYSFVYLYLLESKSNDYTVAVALLWIILASYVVLNHKFRQSVKKVATETILRLMNRFLVFVDTSFHVSNINRYSLKLLGYSTEDVVEAFFPDLFYDRDLVLLYLRKALKEENNYNVEINIFNHNNEIIPLSLSFTLVKDEFGDYLGIAVFGEDNREAMMLQNEIAYRKEIEQNLEKIKEELNNRVKDRTHELIKSYKELQIKVTERMKVEEQIKIEITEKETLISEIFYRVKSNMQMIIALINAQTNQNIAEPARQKFIELSQRVKSILLVQEYLYISISYSYVDFASFIRHLVDSLIVLYNRQNKIVVDLQVSEVYLNIDFAIPLGIVMNELISNALSHAFTDKFMQNNPDTVPKLMISYRFENDQYEIIIADNGAGMPKNEDLKKKETVGLQLIQVLVNEQIGGMFYVSSKFKKTMASIVFDDKKSG